MAIHGLTKKTADGWYVCDEDPGKRDTLEESRQAGATIFHFETIPNVVITDIQDDQASQTIRALDGATGMEQVVNQRSGRRNRDCFRFAVKSIENFRDEDDEIIQVEMDKMLRQGQLYDIVHERTMDRIHSSTVNEVGATIFQRNSMTGAKRKKLEAALSEVGVSMTGNATDAASKTNSSEDASETQDTETSKTSTE